MENARQTTGFELFLTYFKDNVNMSLGSWSQTRRAKMLFAITSRSRDGLEKRAIAVQEGLSRKSVFDALEPILRRVASKLGEKFCMKNWETWAIDHTLFSVEEVPRMVTETELEERLLRTYRDYP